ncbi:Crp/Fnr family transcriptional regulator [Halobacteriovorax sp. HLS]|uniref:Crp/Fnr family transcriptional regulator n=1 Tax=Halobacteriovorax sp. HLS TaxID=2234000 RepID=UPI000FD888B8|nr:cyclic nucleotide-binding domain-containing protein [Halobacteriovorax sp. HLS]
MNDSLKQDNFKDVINFKKDAVLFIEGEASSFMYIIAKGRIGILKENDGKVMPLAIVGEKSFIGEMSLFNDEKRSATAVALEDSEVFMIKKSDIKKVLKNCPEWVSNIMVTLTDRLRDVDELMREHRVFDNELIEKFEVNSSEQKVILKSIDEYKKRRGL